MSEESPNRTPALSPEELRIKQFEAELESRNQLAAAAEKEIARCWDAYKKATNIILAVLAILAAIGAFLGFKTLSDIRESARSAATNEVAKVNEEIKKELARQFEKDTIQKMIVDAARERIDLVADPIIRSNISVNISPMRRELFDTLTTSRQRQDSQMEEFNRSLKQSQITESNLQAVISEASKAVHRLDQDSEFVTKATLAEHDDRAAYEQLVIWQHDPSFKHHASAELVAERIATSFYGPRKNWATFDWDALPPYTNRNAWTIADIDAVWSGLSSTLATAYIDLVWGNTNITMEQRISFLRNAYLKDSRNSLQAAHAAAELVARELGAKYNPAFQYADVERRWLSYSTTNHLFIMPASVPSNMVFDLIPPSSTNRVMILKDWGKTKLVLFKLEHPAITNSIDATYFKYSVNCVNTLLMVKPNHLNAVWAYFNDWEDNDIKCEFRYQRDMSKTNVQSISVTTNMVIFDGSVQFPIP